jgi:hypothetical protein
MNWYLAKIVFRIVCGEGLHTPQFDEQLRLIQAGSTLQAFEKARQIGKNEQETIVSDNQRMVEWQFIDVPELYCISSLIDGAELYSRVHETENAGEYMSLVNSKAEQLLSRSSYKNLELS